MSTVKFTPRTMPASGEALRQELQTALQKASPLDDFIQLVRDLTQMENDFQLDSAEFYTRFQRGELGDGLEFTRWANKYEIFQETKEDLEHVLDLLAQYPLAALG